MLVHTGSFLLKWDNINNRFVVSFSFELNGAIHQCEECVVFAQANVHAGIMRCAALTYHDVAGFGKLPAINLYTKTFAMRFASV